MTSPLSPLIGIDASWAASGLAIVYPGLKEPWKQAICQTVKTSAKKYPNEAERLFHIARTTVLLARDHGVGGVYVEDVYAGFAVKKLARLRGVLDVEFWTISGLQIQPVNFTEARKLLLGPTKKMSRKEIKKLVLNTWQAAGAPVKDDAQADALTIANYGLKLRGYECLKNQLKK